MNLYGWYSWPSIFLGFIGGYLLDNIFGLRFGTALSCLLVVIGQVFLSMGEASEITKIGGPKSSKLTDIFIFERIVQV